LFDGSYLNDVACAVFESVGDRAPVQVVGGLSVEQAVALARRAARLRHQRQSRPARRHVALRLPGDQIKRHIRDFIDQVSAADWRRSFGKCRYLYDPYGLSSL
jgi:hypothetical protein